MIAGVERAAASAEENDQNSTDSDNEDTASEDKRESKDDRGNNSVSDDDSSDNSEEKDEEEYDLIHESNQKTRHNTNNDGIFVEELEIIDELPELAEEQNAENEYDNEDGEDDVGQEECDVSEDSQSQNTNDDDNIHGDELSLDHRSDNCDSGPRRSTRVRTEPERLKPTLMGKSYIIQSMGTKLKRHVKKDLNIRAKKNFQ